MSASCPKCSGEVVPCQDQSSYLKCTGCGRNICGQRVVICLRHPQCPFAICRACGTSGGGGGGGSGGGRTAGGGGSGSGHPCRYGSGCYQTSAEHLQRYSHPPGHQPARRTAGGGGSGNRTCYTCGQPGHMSRECPQGGGGGGGRRGGGGDRNGGGGANVLQMGETSIPHGFFREEDIGKDHCSTGGRCNRLDCAHVLGCHPTSFSQMQNTNRTGRVIGFHMTDARTASKILHSPQGFRCGTSGMFGGGIYFAETYDDVVGKAHNEGVVFCCIVSIGTPLVVSAPDRGLTLSKVRAQSCDSVYARVAAGSVSRPEFLVFEPHRIEFFAMVISDRGPGLDANVKNFTTGLLEDKFGDGVPAGFFQQLIAAADEARKQPPCRECGAELGENMAHNLHCSQDTLSRGPVPRGGCPECRQLPDDTGIYAPRGQIAHRVGCSRSRY